MFGGTQKRERGFTLIELMVAVAIVGILASLAVYMFGGQQKKITARTEVTAMFAELSIRQDEYFLENGSYLSSSSTNAEDDPWPATVATGGQKSALAPLPAEWTTLRIATGQSFVYCTYVTIVGTDETSAVGTVAANDFNYTAPARDWYYNLAECDMDQTAVNSFYFQSNDDQTLFFINQGR